MPLFKDKSADRLYAHLLNLGIQVQLLHEHSLQKVATKKNKVGTILLGIITGGWDPERKSLGLIQVTGKSIGYINVIRASGVSGQFRYRDYYLEYLVLLEDIPSSSCWAVLETKKRGLFRQEVVDIEWTGGTLADTLNGDLTLKDNLLNEFQLNSPLDIIVVPEPAYRCARIETAERLLCLPSGSLFDCLDRIAGLTAEHVTEVNSRPETILFEAKIEFNPRSKDAEAANCYVTDRHVRIESRQPLQIALYMLKDCHVYTPLPLSSFGAGTSVVSGSTVTLRYLDESGHRRKVEFEMETYEAGSLEKLIHGFYPQGITRGGEWEGR